MLYFIVMFVGVLISLMIAFNGALGQYLSVFEVSFMVHLIGLVLLLVTMVIKREPLKLRGFPKWFYLTGVLGACLTAIDAYVVGAIGVTLAVTLSTLAQLLGSAAIDSIGIGHLKRVPFNSKRLGAIGLLFIGVAIMLVSQWKGW